MSIDDWLPLGTVRRSPIPEVGQTVALYRAAWVVTHSTAAMATDAEEERLRQYKPEARSSKAPRNLSLRRIHGPACDDEDDRQEIGLRVPAGFWHGWQVYDEGRVPLCSCCGDPWPCLMLDIAKESERSARILEEQMARATPGKCYTCGEEITPRQATVTYPEGNVEIPGFPPPEFHARQSCRHGVRDYAKARAKVLPDAPFVPTQDQTGRLL